MLTSPHPILVIPLSPTTTQHTIYNFYFSVVGGFLHKRLTTLKVTAGRSFLVLLVLIFYFHGPE